MNLHEYQIKKLFIKYNLPIPNGFVCTMPSEVEDNVRKIGSGPWTVKCQIHAGGRGEAGGVKILKSKEKVRSFAEYWLGKRLKTKQTGTNGQLVNQILVEETINVAKEIYLAGIIDYKSCQIVFMVSAKGGIEIEQVVKEKPHLIHKIVIDPLTGPMPFQGRKLAFKIGLENKLIQQFTDIFMKIATFFLEYDLTLVEINPLAITSQGKLVCLDGKLIVDDNALFRQSSLYKMHDQSQEDYRETWATQWKLNYITLDGNIGCMVNGAGLAMSTMDIIESYGGKPANFLDMSGKVNEERIIEAFKIILSNKKVNVILINIFGGIVCCDLVSNSIIKAIKITETRIPIIIRLEGNNAELGINKLINSNLNNINLVKNLTDAVKLAVLTAKK